MIYRTLNRFPAETVMTEADGSLPIAAGRPVDDTVEGAGKECDLRRASWFVRLSGRQFLNWAPQQLDIQPYQHLLEIGYGAGQLTAEVARTLKVGFIAGIESSIPLYQKAYRRNKQFVHQQLLQLHIGQTYELPYPSHYFHRAYGVNIHLAYRDLNTEILRLSSLLKSKGRLVLLLEAGRGNTDINKEAIRLREEYHSAGLTGIHIERQSSSPDNGLAIIGFKG